MNTKAKLVTLEDLRTLRIQDVKSGKISSSCLPEDIVDQQVETRSKMKCKTCGGGGTEWYRGPISGCCGEAQSEDRICSECDGKSSPHYIMCKHPAGFISGWFDLDVRLW
jgi:hypothetical protein